MEIRAAAVAGLGTMGAGIAEVLARAGISVVAIESDPGALARGLGALDASLSKSVSRGRLQPGEQAEIRARVRGAAGFSEAAGVDLAIEVVPEKLAVKREVFAALDRVCSPAAILATNTSSLSVTEIAAGTRHPGRVVGLHFFNPAPAMRLVEVVSTVLSDPAVPRAAADLARRLGKVPVGVGDRAGFVANALLLPYLNHAVTLLETGQATAADIDLAATAGIGLPMGPLALADLIGLDTCLSVLEVLHAEFARPRYAPAPLLRRLVAAGRTGRKAGRGIYGYEGGTGEAGGDAAPAGAVTLPGTVTLIGPGDEQEAGLASALAAAGLSVTRNPAHRSDLVLVIAAPGRPAGPAAAAAGRAGNAVGVHLPPAPPGQRGLAELVRTHRTSGEAMDAAAALAARLGLTVVRAPDRPGFLVAALLYPHLADAVRMAGEGYASAADIDTAMTLGCGYPRGPMALADQIGAAALAAGLRAMHAASGDASLVPPPLLAEHAADGTPLAAAGPAGAARHDPAGRGAAAGDGAAAIAGAAR